VILAEEKRRRSLVVGRRPNLVVPGVVGKRLNPQNPLESITVFRDQWLFRTAEYQAVSADDRRPKTDDDVFLCASHT